MIIIIQKTKARLASASVSKAHRRATGTEPRERRVTANLHVTGGEGGEGREGEKGGVYWRAVAKSIWAVGDREQRVWKVDERAQKCIVCASFFLPL